eukprot:821158-Prymnesium_polylepis.1
MHTCCTTSSHLLSGCTTQSCSDRSVVCTTPHSRRDWRCPLPRATKHQTEVARSGVCAVRIACDRSGQRAGRAACWTAARMDNHQTIMRSYYTYQPLF